MLARHAGVATSQGYTLLELLVTVAILGIVAAIALPAWSGYTNESHEVTAMTRLSVISMALEEFNAENNTYETGLERLRLADNDRHYHYQIRHVNRQAYRIEATPIDSQRDLHTLSLDHLGRQQHRLGTTDPWRDGWP